MSQLWQHQTKMSRGPYLCFVLALLTMITAGIGGCKPSDTIPSSDPMRPSAFTIPPGLAHASLGLGFDLLRSIEADHRDHNILISPPSVGTLLAMVNVGASGSTREEISAVLAGSSLDPATVHLDYGAMVAPLSGSSGGIHLSMANCLALQQDIAIQTEFIGAIEQGFRAHVMRLDLSSPAAADQINHWVESQTDRQITDLLDCTEPDAVFIGVNTIYFNGRWQDRFDPRLTSDGVFMCADGTEVTVRYMNAIAQFQYLSSTDFSAVSLPYGDGSVSMVVCLPDSKTGVAGFLAQLTPDGWEDWMNEFTPATGRLSIPRFRYSSRLELNDPLVQQGVRAAFDPSRAHFSGVSSELTDLYLNSVIHQTFISVTEDGTEASAATSADVATSPPPDVRFIADRPFLYAIRDNRTRLLLFIGIVSDPS